MRLWLRTLTVSLVALIIVGSLLAPAVQAAKTEDNAFAWLWGRTDKPIVDGRVSRTWMWGPAITGIIDEPYAEADDGQRNVQYFDKGRMEVNTREGIDPNDDWYVTSGLLATELISGRLQTGSNQFEERSSAEVNVAGDAGDPDAPTYATFTNLRDEPAAQDGATLTQRVTRDGAVSDDPALAGHNVTAAQRVTVPNLDHQVASPFWDFMTSSGLIWTEARYTQDALFSDPFFVTGYPITEAYWLRATVAGVEKDVLVQIFERRVLTFTPDNPPEWQVEQANVGRHYYQWRYGEIPAPPPPIQDQIPTPAGGPDMAALDAQLRPLINSWGGQQALAVTDLQTGETISINGARPQLAACTNKIYIMIAVAQDIGAGLYTHDDIAYLVERAMGPSSTPEARELIRIVGGGDIGAGIHRINGIMQELGATSSIMAHPPAYPWEEYGYGGENLLTSEDLNRTLGKLYRGDVLSPEMTDYVLWSMTIATPFLNGSLGGPLPSDTTLYHKIGALYEPNETWNDAGIVVFQRDGQQYAYAISYLGTGDGDSYHVSYDHGYQLSEIVWQAFSGG